MNNKFQDELDKEINELNLNSAKILEYLDLEMLQEEQQNLNSVQIDSHEELEVILSNSAVNIEQIQSNFESLDIHEAKVKEVFAKVKLKDNNTDFSINFKNSESFLDSNLISTQKIIRKKVAEGIWQINIGAKKSFYLINFKVPNPVNSATAIALANIANKWSDNRLRLSESGKIEMLFQNEESLEKALQELSELDIAIGDSFHPFDVLYCRGTLFCRLAAANTILVATSLEKHFANHLWKSSSNKKIKFYIAGCQTITGNSCGLGLEEGLYLIGMRETAPVFEPEILSYSNKLEQLASGCPRSAIAVIKNNNSVNVSINEKKCFSCGWCQANDPSFHFIAPQKSYFSLWGAYKKDQKFTTSCIIRYIENRPSSWIELGNTLIKISEKWLFSKNKSISFPEFMQDHLKSIKKI